MLRKLATVIAVLLIVALEAFNHWGEFALAAGPDNSTYVAYADLTASTSVQQILKQNPKRYCAVCCNTGATNDVRIGDSTVGSATGTRMTAGGGVTICTTSSLYVYSTSGTTVNCGEVVSP